jgi:hypothetical protein
MAGERRSEAFVRHFGYLRERTGNDPREMIRAVAEHPSLSASIKMLGEIFREVDQIRKTGRVISTSEPKFYETLKDFESRWVLAYNEFRKQVFAEATVQISKELLRHHRLLVKRTGGSPRALQQALLAHRGLDNSVSELGKIQDALKQHPDLYAYLLRTSPEAHDALGQITAWRYASVRLDGPVQPRPPDHAAPARPTKSRLNGVLDSLPPSIEEEANPQRFDPNRDNVADILVELEQRCWDDVGPSSEDFESRAANGLKWLRENSGIDFGELQERWTEVFFVVPQQASDEFAQFQPRGLFVYLNQIKLAYIAGADLSAIALCRATTEVLIRTHYASDFPYAEDTQKTKLTGDRSLIRHAENKYRFLRHFNLYDKVEVANEILHKPKLVEAEAAENSIGRPHPDPMRELARGWIRALGQMIGKVSSEAQL